MSISFHAHVSIAVTNSADGSSPDPTASVRLLLGEQDILRSIPSAESGAIAAIVLVPTTSCRDSLGGKTRHAEPP